ncbi:uncharacterized protein EDB91DRAFT_1080639 [Suillus paluster]|uniref:uncharacterized protein n=1 Tax=Suillus paluster TaxID=48578 RepID=UPI001B87E525|nr:uncharacterized protein EDB91DRAFT_1080639 [Suillus paluster]KAG1744524.1 hypothetical protein EDB91DRAFT_1080639 [Suillus paluster]
MSRKLSLGVEGGDDGKDERDGKDDEEREEECVSGGLPWLLICCCTNRVEDLLQECLTSVFYLSFTGAKSSENAKILNIINKPRLDVFTPAHGLLHVALKKVSGDTVDFDELRALLEGRQTKQRPKFLTAINVLQLIVRQVPNLKYPNNTRGWQLAYPNITRVQPSSQTSLSSFILAPAYLGGPFNLLSFSVFYCHPPQMEHWQEVLLASLLCSQVWI